MSGYLLILLSFVLPVLSGQYDAFLPLVVASLALLYLYYPFRRLRIEKDPVYINKQKSVSLGMKLLVVSFLTSAIAAAYGLALPTGWDISTTILTLVGLATLLIGAFAAFGGPFVWKRKPFSPPA